MRIAFVGLPLAALLLLEDGHELVYAGVCRTGAPGTRRLRRLLGEGRVFVKPDLSAHAGHIRALSPDLLVSWFWTLRVPGEVRSAARLGAFGVHPSLLPRHRGPDPYFWAIDSGDEVTGVTAHLLEAGYDTGALLGSRKLSIDPSWNAWTLAKKLDRLSLALLRQVARAMAEGRAPTPAPQDEGLATLAPLPTEEDLEIDWARPAADIVRRIRAAAPFPGAFTFLGDELLIIERAGLASSLPLSLSRGEAAVRQDGIAVVRASDGGVELLAGRIAGDGDDELGLGPEEIARLIQSASRGGKGVPLRDALSID